MIDYGLEQITPYRDIGRFTFGYMIKGFTLLVYNAVKDKVIALSRHRFFYIGLEIAINHRNIAATFSFFAKAFNVVESSRNELNI